MITSFLDLSVWQRARKLVKQVYLLSARFPKAEMYGLTSQVRRVAVSVPSNIAEGCGRRSRKELSRFLDFAIGSTCEAETQLYLACALIYISKEEQDLIIEEIRQIRMRLIGFQKARCR